MPKVESGIIIKLLISFGLPIGVLFMPIDWIPIDDLTLIQHRLLAIFLLSSPTLGTRARPSVCDFDFDHRLRAGDDFRQRATFIPQPSCRT